MLFNSYIFIFCFIPISLLGYFLINKFNYKISNCFIIGMSLWFYGYFNYSYLIIIVFSIIFNYIISRILYIVKYKKAILFIGILVNVTIIFYYKYYNFFIQNINILFNLNYAIKDIILPLGISFFTFQQISFLVDSYNEETKNYTFIEYAMFVSFFPQLIAGPIVLHNELIPMFRDNTLRKVNFKNMSEGIIIFVLGLSKKVFIADVLNNLVNWGFSNYNYTTTMDLIITMVSYTFQIYFDFSGYSDMAQGIARMFNFSLPINFNSPYKSTSIIDFWKRWHMSLTRFLTRYVYIPLGGNRKGELRTYINIFVTFIISGIWHGANWTFILWGALYGFLQILNRIYIIIISKLKKNEYYIENFKKTTILQSSKLQNHKFYNVNNIYKIIKWSVTFYIINILWLLFRANTIKQWIMMSKKIIIIKNVFSLSNELIDTFEPLKYINPIINKTPILIDFTLQIKLFIVILYLLVILIICLFFENNYNRKHKVSIGTAILYSFILVFCIYCFSNVSPFLYFNF